MPAISKRIAFDWLVISTLNLGHHFRSSILVESPLLIQTLLRHCQVGVIMSMFSVQESLFQDVTGRLLQPACPKTAFHHIHKMSGESPGIQAVCWRQFQLLEVFLDLTGRFWRWEPPLETSHCSMVQCFPYLGEKLCPRVRSVQQLTHTQVAWHYDSKQPEGIILNM